MQYTLAIIKPDVLNRRLSGACISIIEREFTIEKMKLMKFDEKIARDFYAEHVEKPFFQEILHDITNGNLIVMVLSGQNVINKWRDFIGTTDPKKATPNTLRFQFGISIGLNSFHGSLTEQDANREINILFND